VTAAGAAGAPAARGAAALVAAALALAGCGEDRGGATSTDTTAAPAPAPAQPEAPPEPPVAEVRLTESDYRLDPAQIRVDRPATLEIEVRNRGERRHALSVEDGGSGARTRTLDPGESQVLRVELAEPGRYRWYCPVDGHARRGMRGSIAVARGGD
jgi:plastocyanin